MSSPSSTAGPYSGGERSGTLLRQLAGQVPELLAALLWRTDALPSSEVAGELAALRTDLQAARDPEAWQRCWDRAHARITAFARRQQEALDERDGEVRALVALIQQGLLANQAFYAELDTRRQDAAASLTTGDLETIKQALAQQLEGLARGVQAKRDQDDRQIERLQQQVRTLTLEVASLVEDTRRDPLTGLYTRPALERCLTGLMTFKTLRDAPLALVLVSIDGFDRIRGTYGGPLAERVVLAIGRQCDQHCRSQDMAARLSEERFAILLPRATPRDAVAGGRALVRQVAATRYALDEVAVGHRLGFTVSAGLGWRHRQDSPAALTERAQRALAAARRAGGNRLVSEGVGYLAKIVRGVPFLDRV